MGNNTGGGDLPALYPSYSRWAGPCRVFAYSMRLLGPISNRFYPINVALFALALRNKPLCRIRFPRYQQCPGCVLVCAFDLHLQNNPVRSGLLLLLLLFSPPAIAAAAATATAAAAAATAVAVAAAAVFTVVIVVVLHEDLGVVCPMFCAACFLQKGVHRTSLKNAMRAHFRDKLQVVYRVPAGVDVHANEAYLRSAFRMLDWADDLDISEGDGAAAGLDADTLSEARRARRESREYVAKALSASDIVDGVITEPRHLCMLGCHAQLDAVADDIADHVERAHLDLTAKVPALNRQYPICGTPAHAHARAHTRTHAHMHARTHARPRAYVCANVCIIIIIVSIPLLLSTSLLLSIVSIPSLLSFLSTPFLSIPLLLSFV